jgi:RNA polymerase sigma factor (sigma-70 family)
MSTPPDAPAPADPPADATDPIAELEELVEQLRPRVKQMLASYRIPYPDTEDLLQDVLVAAFRKWDSIHTKDAWLIGTLRHKCWMYWKRRRNDRLQAVDLPMLESLSEPQPPLQERSERLWDLETLCAGLCLRHRTVLWLRFGLGMSTDEVAERTGYHHSSIRKLTCRTVARLQRELVAPLPRAAGPKPA